MILTFLGNNLLAVLRPLLVAVCSDQTKFPDKNLRSAASLALAKYMLVRYVIGLIYEIIYDNGNYLS